MPVYESRLIKGIDATQYTGGIEQFDALCTRFPNLGFRTLMKTSHGYHFSTGDVCIYENDYIVLLPRGRIDIFVQDKTAEKIGGSENLIAYVMRAAFFERHFKKSEGDEHGQTNSKSSKTSGAASS